jgi:hypothetical protein
MDELQLDDVRSIDQEKERSSFLTVICILSFVGNGLGIAQGFLVFSLAGFYYRMFHSVAAVGQGTLKSQMRTVDSVINAVSWFGIIVLLSSIVCLIGAILMWRLKKIGYMLYVPFQMIPVVYFVFSLLSFIPAEGHGVALMFGFFYSLLPLAFIVLFGIQLKQMK